MREIGFYDTNTAQTVIALGFFDAVHRGHVKVINECITTAKKLKVESSVFTFENNPADFFKKDSKLLCTLKERKEKFNELGVDNVVCAPCNSKFFETSPIDFLNHLKDNLNVVGIVCGVDYTYGKNGSGNVESLIKYCKENDIACVVVDKVLSNGIKISSSNIRNTVENGELDIANSLLGYKYSVCGMVKKGRGEGKKSLFPTINIDFPEYKAIPKEGVYATKTVICEKEYASVTNIGAHPTFEDYTKNIETYVIDFEGDLYGEEVTVSFIKKLREISKFESIELLKKQICKDITEARKLL